jgi:hypothetical protein
MFIGQKITGMSTSPASAFWVRAGQKTSKARVRQEEVDRVSEKMKMPRKGTPSEAIPKTKQLHCVPGLTRACLLFHESHLFLMRVGHARAPAS